MPIVTAGVFNLDYTLFTNAGAGGDDLQFGMDFTLTSNQGRPLTQLIFPAVNVGNNLPGRWNVDNRMQGQPCPQSLVFGGAMGGTINDTPREIVPRNTGLKRTKFVVFIVDINGNKVQGNGVAFGYAIDTGAADPQTSFEGLNVQVVTNEQRGALSAQCPNVGFR